MLDISIPKINELSVNTILDTEWIASEKYDGCFEYNTPIETKEFGILPIGKIVDEKIECNVKSFNHSTNTYEWKPITNYSNKGKGINWIKLTMENGKTLIVTDNHWVWSDDRQTYIQVKDLKVNENLKWKE